MNSQQQYEFDTASKANWQHFCDYIPVDSPKLAYFWLELKRKMPDLVILEGRRGMNKVIDGATTITYRAISLAHIKSPTEKVGTIEYDQYDDKYVVYSRLIRNEKFGRWNSDHESKSSKHMNKMLKLAKEVLIPKQLHEVYGESKQEFFGAISEVRSNAARSLRDKVGCIGMVDWREELLAMHRANYVPEVAEIRSALEYVVANEESFNNDYNYRPETAFVWIKPDGVSYQYLNSQGNKAEESVDVSSTEALPEKIRDKLFVLMVSDNRNYIEGIGSKQANDKFWVIL